jgi:hypothetical protein
MKYISALFLTLLIAPFAFAQSEDIIELIQKSDEGREVINNVFLQASVEGPKVDINKVRAVLKNIDAGLRLHREHRRKLRKVVKKECQADFKALKQRWHDLTLRALSVKRAVVRAQRREKRQARFLKRAEEELSHYTKFASMLRENQKGWSNFWSTLKRNTQKVLGLLHQSLSHLKALKKHYKKSCPH